VWTLPEFKKVDFTVKPVIVPPTMRPRIVGMRFPKLFAIAEVRMPAVIFVVGEKYLPVPGQEKPESSSFQSANDIKSDTKLV
jgi:hypothetical protein